MSTNAAPNPSLRIEVLVRSRRWLVRDNEALRGEVERLTDQYTDVAMRAGNAEQDLDALTFEVERLRAALQHYADAASWSTGVGRYPVAVVLGSRERDGWSVAREALGAIAVNGEPE